MNKFLAITAVLWLSLNAHVVSGQTMSSKTERFFVTSVLDDPSSRENGTIKITISSTPGFDPSNQMVLIRQHVLLSEKLKAEAAGLARGVYDYYAHPFNQTEPDIKSLYLENFRGMLLSLMTNGSFSTIRFNDNNLQVCESHGKTLMIASQTWKFDDITSYNMDSSRP